MDNKQDATTEKAKSRVKIRLDVKDVVRKDPKPQDKPEDGGFEPTVLFEDNHLLVVVKPQNVPTQSDISGDPDLLSLLKEYLIKKYNKPGDAYLGLLHRLDRPTGGVMVFAKTSKAAGRLSEQIRSGDFDKTYVAVTVGRPNRTGRVEHFLTKDEKTNTVTLAPSSLPGVKRALSEVRVESEKDGLFLVTVRLLTGRTHQARVQLKSLGSPIVGDVKYAGDRLVKSPHLALWAYKLRFAHPISGDEMTFIAEPPKEFPWDGFDISDIVDVVRPQDKHY